MTQISESFAELRALARDCLEMSVPDLKVAAVHRLWWHWSAGVLSLDSVRDMSDTAMQVGRPDKPELVLPKTLPRRAMHTVAGRANLIHALTHIEFNAINLALDAVWRFSCMPTAYYRDWLQVAQEEAYHFTLLNDHLRTLGHAYGDFEAHGSLWEMAEKTQGDVLARMALVPRTMEARGLDATPAVRAKLAQAGDAAAAAILDIILRDEVGHVAIGNRWFGWLCRERGLDPVPTYAILAERYRAPQLRGPFNLDARRAAGFTEDELKALQLARFEMTERA